MVNYNIAINDEKDTIIVQLLDEPFKGTIAKIGNIAWNEQGEAEFDMELPESKVELYKNDDFCNIIQDVVGDIIRKSVNMVWSESAKAVLTDLNDRVAEAFKPYKYSAPEGSSFIEMFGQKGYVISEDDEDRLTAVNLSNNKTYYFDNAEQLAFLKKEISGSGIILTGN